MKTNAPEKIYLFENPITETPDDRWLSKRSDKNDIEYIRKDAFVEKANKWLSLNMKMLMNVLDVEYDTHDTDIKDFIEDFVRYIKD